MVLRRKEFFAGWDGLVLVWWLGGRGDVLFPVWAGRIRGKNGWSAGWSVERSQMGWGGVVWRGPCPSRDWAWLSLWGVRGIGVENRDSGLGNRGIGKSGVENRESEGLKGNGLIHLL